MSLHGALATSPLVPVVTSSDSDRTVAIIDALIGGGVPLVEFTLRTPHALDAIRLASTTTLLVGAGSVRDVADARAAVNAGAQFLVMPGTQPEVLDWSLDAGIEAIPAVATPTEALAARARGIDLVKFFPASVLGGPAWLRAVSAPIPDLRFLPTGGIGETSFEEYLAVPSVIAVGGSWFLPPPPSVQLVRDTLERARLARALSG